MACDDYFDERVAANYDNDVGAFNPQAVDPAVNFLFNLVGDGRALEFGIGTGRIALPLAQRGVEVHGIDLSKAMLARLAAKPGGRDIPVILGDFATTSCDRTFDLVYLVFNTIMNLTTQEAQVACFLNAAAHLKPGGYFLIEVMVPALQKIPPGESRHVFDFSEDHWGIDDYDLGSQGLVSHHVTIRNGQMEHSSVPFRYVWPSELDLMAQIAGMRLKERWGGWHREAFTSTSSSHVSVWEKITSHVVH